MLDIFSLVGTLWPHQTIPTIVKTLLSITSSISLNAKSALLTSTSAIFIISSFYKALQYCARALLAGVIGYPL